MKFINLLLRPFSGNICFFLCLSFLLGTVDSFDLIEDSLARGIETNLNVSVAKFIYSFTQASFYSYIICWICMWAHNRKWIKAIFFGIAIIMCFGDLMCLLSTNMHFNFLVYNVVSETNPSESSEFLTMMFSDSKPYIAAMITTGIIAVGVLLSLIWRIRRPIVQWLNMMLLVLVGVGVVTFFHGLILPVVFHANMQPLAESLPSRLVLSHVKALRNRPDYSVLRATTLSCEIDSVSSRPEVVMLILGESYNRHHCGLYGYKNTTPRMQAMADNGELIVYTDVVTGRSLTDQVMPDIFTMRPYGLDAPWETYPLFPSLFKKAGYHTSYFNCQSAGMQGYESVPYFIDPEIRRANFDYCNADHVTYDIDMLTQIKQHDPKDKPWFLILGLSGQHHQAYKRYPLGFGTFTADDYPDSLNMRQRTEIAQYDNSCLYNDSVIAMTFDYFRDREAVIIYVSDHGEEVHDFRDNYGRKIGEISEDIVRNVYEVPMVVWCSPKYAQRHPDIVQRIRESRDKPCMNADVSHMLIELGNIHTKWFVPERSVINPRYKPFKRVLFKGWEYDK